MNRGKTTAADVLRLIGEIQKKALESRQVSLETEVQIIGEDEVVF